MWRSSQPQLNPEPNKNKFLSTVNVLWYWLLPLEGSAVIRGCKSGFYMRKFLNKKLIVQCFRKHILFKNQQDEYK